MNKFTYEFLNDRLRIVYKLNDLDNIVIGIKYFTSDLNVFCNSIRKAEKLINTRVDQLNEKRT